MVQRISQLSKILIFAFFIQVAGFGISVGFAKDACITEAEWLKLKNGKWVKFKDTISGETYFGKVKYFPGGRRKIIMSDGTTFDKGSWRKIGNSIKVHSPERPGKTRLTYFIKKKCN